MMKGMSMGGTASTSAVGDIKPEDDTMNVLSSDEDSEVEVNDDEDDREGLQARYEAAMETQEDSTAAEASFAKYLYSQRG
jgi:hypothetical protein